MNLIQIKESILVQRNPRMEKAGGQEEAEKASNNSSTKFEDVVA